MHAAGNLRIRGDRNSHHIPSVLTPKMLTGSLWRRTAGLDGGSWTSGRLLLAWHWAGNL